MGLGLVAFHSEAPSTILGSGRACDGAYHNVSGVDVRWLADRVSDSVSDRFGLECNLTETAHGLCCRGIGDGVGQLSFDHAGIDAGDADIAVFLA